MFFYIYIIIFVLVFLVVLLGILFYQSSKNKAKANEQFEINNKTLADLQSNNFNVSKIFYICDNNTYKKENSYKKMLVVDNDNKKICLVDYNSKNYYIIDFSEFLNYEIYENGGMITSGGVIGGLGIGVLGAETSGNCKDLKLIIRVKDLSKPQVAYDVITHYMAGMGLSKSSPLYRDCMNTLQEVISFLEVVKNDNLQIETAAIN